MKSPKKNLSTIVLNGSVVFIALTLTVFFISKVPAVSAGTPIRMLWEWIPSLGVSLSFMLDGLSLLFALIISGIGTFVAVYSGSYLAGHEHLGRFRVYFTLFMLSMLGLVLADNLVALFVFWEMTTITSYLLIGFDHKSVIGRRSARQALLVTGGAGLAMMAGFILLALAGGSWELSEIRTQGNAVREHVLYLPILVLVLFGAFAKSAQFPFHFWLPNAMAAPTPVSAYLHSATMVKGGIYLMARLYPTLGGTTEWMVPLIIAGGITAVWGSVLALRQNDLKLMLAYTTLMALGVLTMLLGGDNSMAITAMATFLLVHSLYKCALFLVVGAIDHECGTRKLDELGGLAKKMPVTATATAVAALSMAGLPPFLGFIGKELIYQGAVDQKVMQLFVMLASLTANMLMVAVAGIFFLRPFFGAFVATPRKPHEAPIQMWLGPVCLAAAGLIFGLGAGMVGDLLIQPAVSAVLNAPTPFHLALFHGVNAPLILSGVTILLGLLLFKFRDPLSLWVQRLESKLPTGDAAYDGFLAGISRTAHWQTNMLQNGSLPRYLGTVFATIALLVGSTLLFKGGVSASLEFPDLQFYEWTILLIILAAVAVTLRATSRLMAICALGVIGSSVGLIFLMYGAPDVALTQLTVEILVVVLVTVALLKLPGHASVAESKGTEKLVRAIIALSVGSIFTLIMLGVNNSPLDLRITDYYAAYSYSLAHGRNIVNVVLVDFRGFDTLGEITVLTVAGITAYQMIKLRLGRDKS